MKFLRQNIEYIIIPLLFVVITVLQKARILNPYVMQVLLLAGINIILTLSLNLVNGMTGQSSIGHAGFMSVGAYTAALITTVVFKASAMTAVMKVVTFLAASICGGISAALCGYLVGVPTLRLKGDYLAIVTLGFGEVIRAIVRITPVVGGARGLVGIPKLASFFWVFTFVFLTIYATRNFMDSSYGRACMAVRDNDIAADTLGINISRYKIIAFVFSAFIAGVGGSLYAHVIQYLHPDVFSFVKSSDFLVYLYAGGVGSISGAIIGAFTLTVLPEVLRQIANLRLVLYGLLLILIILFRPLGIFGGREFGFLKLKTGGIKILGFTGFKRKSGKCNVEEGRI